MMGTWKVGVQRKGTGSGDYVNVDAETAEDARAAAIAEKGDEWEPIPGETWQQSA